MKTTLTDYIVGISFIVMLMDRSISWLMDINVDAPMAIIMVYTKIIFLGVDGLLFWVKWENMSLYFNGVHLLRGALISTE